MLGATEPMIRAIAGREAGVALLRFETPEDLAAGAIADSLRALDGFEWKGEEAFRAWVVQIARRHLSGRRDYWFACKRHAGALLRLSMTGSGGERLERRELADTATGPGTFAFRREQAILAVRALAMLLPRDRQIVTWTNEGVLVEEQARRLGISHDSAEKARTRAVERLRRAFALLARAQSRPER
jgi:DNA-directed RNA polymerase specialized sigma24 family protein